LEKLARNGQSTRVGWCIEQGNEAGGVWVGGDLRIARYVMVFVGVKGETSTVDRTAGYKKWREKSKEKMSGWKWRNTFR
jgi:hypothetical protein